MTILNSGQLPTRATLFLDEFNSLSGALTQAVDAGQIYDTYSAIPQNGVFTFGFWLRAGFYTLNTHGLTLNDQGKLDYSINNVSVASAQDWYTAGLVYNVYKSFTFTLSTEGFNILKVTQNGKNASSSAFLVRLTKFWIQQATD